MAQAGYTPISLYYSTTAAASPAAGDLVAGELALNTLDEKLYFKNSAGTVKLLASTASTLNVSSITFGSTGLTPSTATTGAVTVGGTLATTNGGTGSTSTTYCSLTTNVTGTLPIANGGTGSASTTYCSLTTNVTGTLPVANGGTGVASATAYALLAGGTTTTGPFQSIASVGTSGQVLTSNGAGALPTFQAAAGGVTTISFGSTGLTPNTATSGAVSVAGTLAIANGGTGSTSTTYCSLTSNVTGTLPVANGGTGATTFTTNSVVLGNGTSALNANLVAPGSSGNVLTSNGSTWTSAAAAAGGFTNMTAFVSPGTFTTPATTTKIKVTVVGGGGSGGVAGNPAPTSRGVGGGGGGYAQGIYTVAASSPFAVTIGTGGAAVSTFVGPGGTTPGNSGGTSSFSSLISATGGAGGPSGTGNPGPGTGGTGSGGTVNIQGESSSGSPQQILSGGASLLGFTNLSSGASGQNYGAGGAGLNPNGGTSGSGTGGIVIVEF
jgi:hypothetical protein